MTPEIHGPQRVNDPRDLRAIYRFRARIWRQTGLVDPTRFPPEAWNDPQDEQADHFQIRIDGALAAAVRYTQWPSIAHMPQAEYFLASGAPTDGAVGVPERLVVDPRWRRMGLYRRMANALHQHGRDRGARYLLMECTDAVAALLIARGRRDLGPAPPDPRFPRLSFRWVMTDLAHDTLPPTEGQPTGR